MYFIYILIVYWEDKFNLLINNKINDKHIRIFK
jgi:hypothetical protein